MKKIKKEFIIPDYMLDLKAGKTVKAYAVYFENTFDALIFRDFPEALEKLKKEVSRHADRFNDNNIVIEQLLISPDCLTEEGKELLEKGDYFLTSDLLDYEKMEILNESSSTFLNFDSVREKEWFNYYDHDRLSHYTDQFEFCEGPQDDFMEREYKREGYEVFKNNIDNRSHGLKGELFKLEQYEIFDDPDPENTPLSYSSFYYINESFIKEYFNEI